MRSAVIVSTARTPIGRAYRGAFNDTNAQTLGGHAVRAAVERARLDPAEVEDVIMGAALQQGCQGSNVGRQVALAAGLPDTVPGMSLDRQCSSGLNAIALAAMQIEAGQAEVMVAGGVESDSNRPYLLEKPHAAYQVNPPRFIGRGRRAVARMPRLPAFASCVSLCWHVHGCVQPAD